MDLDKDGHLVDSAHWRPEIADQLAEMDGLTLKSSHWWVIEYVRDYHGRYGNPPLMRTLIKAWREDQGDPSLGSRDLYRLFPDNPVRQACRYGGLPKPDWCI